MTRIRLSALSGFVTELNHWQNLQATHWLCFPDLPQGDPDNLSNARVPLLLPRRVFVSKNAAANASPMHLSSDMHFNMLPTVMLPAARQLPAFPQPPSGFLLFRQSGKFAPGSVSFPVPGVRSRVRIPPGAFFLKLDRNLKLYSKDSMSVSRSLPSPIHHRMFSSVILPEITSKLSFIDLSVDSQLIRS